MIATLAEIQKFLNDFHQKVEVFDILFFEERDKNFDTLKTLNITRDERLEVVKSIEVIDYSEGPIKNILNKSRFVSTLLYTLICCISYKCLRSVKICCREKL